MSKSEESVSEEMEQEYQRTIPYRCLVCSREIKDMEVAQVGWTNGKEWCMVCEECLDSEQSPLLKRLTSELASMKKEIASWVRQELKTIQEERLDDETRAWKFEQLTVKIIHILEGTMVIAELTSQRETKEEE